MKKIEAIVRPERFPGVRQALTKLGVSGITVTEVKGHGRQGGFKQQWRGVEYTVDLLPKVKLEMVVKDADLDRVLATIEENAKTGEIGDGKIFVYEVSESIRVRTGERGEDAI